MVSAAVNGLLVGVFDMFGVEDIDLLAAAATRCEHLHVAVASDEVATALHGFAPVIPAAERRAILSAVRGVERVLAWPETDLSALAASCGAEIVFADARWSGADWTSELDRPVSFLELPRASAARPPSDTGIAEDVA